jgi:Phage capsid family
MPPSGQEVEVPYLVSSSSVATHTEGAAVSEPAADAPDADKVSSPREYIAGQVDASIQAFEFAPDPAAFDVVIAADLGRQLAAKIDSQLIAGTGTKPQLRGLANVSGALSLTYTGSTLANLVSKIWAGYRDLADPAVGFGTSDESQYLIVVHPRRYGYLYPSAVASYPLPGRLVPSAGIRSNLGAGTNEDEIFIVDAGPIHVRANQPVIRVLPEVLSGTLQVRVQAYQEVASAFAPPRAILRISGSGLTPPAL